MNSNLKKGKYRVENNATLESDKIPVYAQKRRPKMLIKNSITVE
jgi:hypothetical protein